MEVECGLERRHSQVEPGNEGNRSLLGLVRGHRSLLTPIVPIFVKDRGIGEGDRVTIVLQAQLQQFQQG